MMATRECQRNVIFSTAQPEPVRPRRNTGPDSAFEDAIGAGEGEGIS